MKHYHYWSIIAAIYLAPFMPKWVRVAFGAVAAFAAVILCIVGV